MESCCGKWGGGWGEWKRVLLEVRGLAGKGLKKGGGGERGRCVEGLKRLLEEKG